MAAGRGRARLTVFPALSRPRMRMQYSSFWNTYLYSPDSNVYILQSGGS